MATGRTVAKYVRIYAGQMGNVWQTKLCGLTRSLGPLKVSFDEIDATGMCDSIKGYLPGQASINPGTINVILDPAAIETAFTFMYPPIDYIGINAFDIGEPTILQIPIGIRAAPVIGDPTFCGVFPFLVKGLRMIWPFSRGSRRNCPMDDSSGTVPSPLSASLMSLK